MFGRIAVVNRGEAAVRLVRAVRELNAERAFGIRTVALHTEAERRAMFVRQADEAVTLQPSATARSPYLDHVELARALREARADAVWVGWGFVAEDPAFAELCARLDIVFIGPPPDAMRLLGDKIEAKLLAERVGVPVAAWSGGPVDTIEDARRHADAITYPMILKARSGGGGRGIRIVRQPEELDDAFDRTRAEAQAAFGDPVVFLERLVTGCRHVEVQVIADNHGTVWAPGVRDCSVQRRNQKLIEESASPVLSAEQSRELRESSAALVKAAGYRGAGTVEYLYQPDEKIFTFLEVNTRLQVEHPITEITTGLDLVKAQILVAHGDPLPGSAPGEFGHAVEARLNAEDAETGFAPAPGTVELLRLPSGPGVRVDTGIAAGDVIPPEYDSMVAKIIAWGRDRPEAMARLRCALRDTTVVIDGGTTIKSFLLALLDSPEVNDGTADTQWIDRVGVDAIAGAPAHADIALLAVAIDVYQVEEALERAAFLASARGGRPRATHALGRAVELRYAGQGYQLDVAQVGPARYRVRAAAAGADPLARPDTTVDVEVDHLGGYESRLLVGDESVRVVTVAGPTGYLVEVNGISYRIVRDEAGVVRAAAPGVVVALKVAPGDEVAAGSAVAVLESMKMETAVTSAYAGRVREILVAVNAQVDAGAALLRLDPEADDAAATDVESVAFDRPVAVPADAAAGARAKLAELRAVVTGYDVSRAEADALVASYTQDRDALDPAARDGLRHDEVALLTVFADICELSRNRPSIEEESPGEAVHSPREHLHTYLHSLDVDREGLPDIFRTKLSRALAHYDVHDVAPTPELEEAVYRIFLAQQRAGAQIPVVTTLLEGWLADGAAGGAPTTDEVAEVLYRVIDATQLRYAVVGNLARSVRFALFDEPAIQRTRTQVYEGVREQLGLLDNDPDAADSPLRQARIDALVGSPEPLTRLLGEYITTKGAALGPMLEVLARRNYRTRELRDLRTFVVDGRHLLTAHYELDGETLHLVETVADFADLHHAAEVVSQVAGRQTGRGEPVVDVYLAWEDPPADQDALSAALRDVATDVPWPAGVRRVTFAVSSHSGADLTHVTFRPTPGGMVEDTVSRGLHPLIGQRLDLWRLGHFDLTRLPADEGVFLCRAVARENANDVRLVALSLVRDVTPIRDGSGRAVAVPAVERVLAQCVDGIRRARAGHPDSLDNNLIFLIVRAQIDIPPDQLVAVAQRMLPLTVGAGIDEIMLLGRLHPPGRTPRDVALRFVYQPGAGVGLTVSDPPAEPVAPMNDYDQKVRRARARGTVYPYEIVPMLTGPEGTFVEHDLDADGALVPVQREPGRNTAGIVVGVVSTPTAGYPEGMARVALFGDPTKALGSVAEAECARVVAALDLAEQMQVPVEWFALSSGARISMDSGTENMDWVARALRRIITFTQDGGEINVVVAGINVGAQPYWNAEATMLMHTRGILVMTPDSAMVLTGKHSLDYSGGVSAEDNFGLGGYDRVMGPNGQAQYWAPNLAAACEVLARHYDHTYVAPGETGPRRAPTTDPFDRDVRTSPHVHPSSDFTTVGDIFSPARNAERKKPFDIRTVMEAVVDQDHRVLERWPRMADAETAVVFDAHLGGYPVTVLGIESRPIPRKGRLPADGPDQWTAGTLFPRSSTKTARAINAASGNRPLVVLANLSGFDGSPESLRLLQLEYGAEIGRAIVNFRGPIVFCVISRYHGGAFVVFSGALNDAMQVVAVEGSYASVIGGAPAAAVVFTGEVNRRTAADGAVKAMEAALGAASDAERPHLRVQLAELRESVRSAKLGEVAAEFEAVHNIARAKQVGSVHEIIPAARLRPYLIDAVTRGLT